MNEFRSVRHSNLLYEKQFSSTTLLSKLIGQGFRSSNGFIYGMNKVSILYYADIDPSLIIGESVESEAVAVAVVPNINIVTAA